MLSRCLLCALSLLATSCSKDYEVIFHVSVADDVEVPNEVFIAFVVLKGLPVEQTLALSRIPVTHGVRDYTGKGSVCCSPNPTVELVAFIDLDGDRKLDADEPRGADPNGPITMSDNPTPYRSEIVITRAP